MILVLGDYPLNDSNLEGMVLRIKDIDNQALAPSKRCYLQLQAPYNLPTNDSAKQLKIFRINSKSPIGFLRIVLLFVKAKTIYAHSLFNLNSSVIRLLLAIFWRKPLFLDLHGALPEEFAYEQKTEECLHFEKVESWASRRASAFIVVSKRMQIHFQKKHLNTKNKLFVLIPTEASSRPEQSHTSRSTEKASFLYSGGLQKWQLVPQVLKAYSRLRPMGYTCSIFTYNLEALEALLGSYPELSGIHRARLSPADLSGEYSKHQYGFVLREDVVVNQVACPTKILDYLAHSIVPVVLSPNIGDLLEWGAPYIEVKNLDGFDFTQTPKLQKEAFEAFLRVQKTRKVGLEQLRQALV